PSPLLLFRWRHRSCASCARDSIGRRANVAPDRFALFASCSPDVSREGGYKSFLATIGRYASTIVNSLAVVLPLSNRGHGARRRPLATPPIVAPGNVNGPQRLRHSRRPQGDRTPCFSSSFSLTITARGRRRLLPVLPERFPRRTPMSTNLLPPSAKSRSEILP